MCEISVLVVCMCVYLLFIYLCTLLDRNWSVSFILLNESSAIQTNDSSWQCGSEISYYYPIYCFCSPVPFDYSRLESLQ